MNPSDKIYVAGHKGMVGSAIVRQLKEEGYNHIIGKSSVQLDLKNQEAVFHFMESEKPDYVFVAAARVGGIHANNTFSADFIYENLMIQANLIHSAHLQSVKKLLFLGSSCIYPKFSPQPIKEEYLLSDDLEPTNEAYAVAKIAGIKSCESYRKQYACNFISAIPCNLYGPNDNYDLHNSHVIPALIRKIIFAKKKDHESVTIWGSGSPLREFLHVDDLASACVYLMKTYDDAPPVNVGTGSELSILDLATLIKEIVGYEGAFVFDRSKPDGTPRKVLDISKIEKLGWRPKIDLRAGLKSIIAQKIKEYG